MADAFFAGFEPFEVALGSAAEPIRLHGRIGGPATSPPLVLLHGYPQSHVMWHRVATQLAPHFRLVIPDLRGYGKSSVPADAPGHAQMGKRAMAGDVRALMRHFGHTRFAVAGHDRGGRVAHRLALDAPEALSRLALLDIAPTLDMVEQADWRFGRAYYHWFFLAQPAPRPERLIGGDALNYLHGKLGGWGAASCAHIEPAALAHYEAAFAQPDRIHAMCEDYRAAFADDMALDRASREAGEKIQCPLLVLWGAKGVVQALFDPMALWRAASADPKQVQGEALDCGHYLPEEQHQATAAALQAFFSA
jgi:haloacetate dehalogenase